MIVRIIVGVLVLTACIMWTMVWFISSSLSENPRVRRRLQFVDAFISLGIGIPYAFALGAANGKERKLAFTISGLVIALWLFRGAKALLHRDNA